MSDEERVIALLHERRRASPADLAMAIHAASSHAASIDPMYSAVAVNIALTRYGGIAAARQELIGQISYALRLLAALPDDKGD